MSERLDRIEELLTQTALQQQQTALQQQRNTENIERNTENIGTLDRKLEVLIEATARNSGEITELKGISQNFSENLMLIIEEQRRDREEFRHRMDLMQSDIRGLQTENRRILERLENHASDGHGN